MKGKYFQRLISLMLCLALIGPVVMGALPALATETDPVYTREDLEEAIVEMAWAYYLKGNKLQYCSQELTSGLSKYYGSTYRLTEDVAPEYGTSDTTIYAVCSDFVYKVYYEALGYRMFGSADYLDAVTDAMWMFCEDVALMRWMNDSYTLTAEDISYGVTTDHVMTLEGARQFLADWEENLRPGDVILPEGHAMLYIGGGYVVDCWGGKYDRTTGLEVFETNGAVHYLHSLEDLYLNGTDPVTQAYWLTENSTKNWFVVFRPLDFFLNTEDGDTNLSNDVLNSTEAALTDSVKSRLSYPGMEIDRTADVAPYRTVATGDTLTYSVAISNCSNDADYLTYHRAFDASYSGQSYSGLAVTETVPAGTVLNPDTISHDGVYNSAANTITWNLNIAAGATVELTYQVTVTAPMGSTITNSGGYVADIPSNSISTGVGGTKLSDAALEGLAELAATNVNLWRTEYNISKLGTDLQFAERVYAKAMGIGLELPTVQQILDNLFTYRSITVPSGSVRYTGSQSANLFTRKEAVPAGYETVASMIVDGYIGGRKLYCAEQNPINEFRMDYLQPGDIIVYANTVGSTVTDDKVMVYAGSNTLLSLDTDQKLRVLCGSGQAMNNQDEAFTALWEAYISDVFFVLRPSLSYTDVNTLSFNTALEPEYDSEYAPAEKAWGSVALSEQKLQALAALTAEDGWEWMNTDFAEEVYAALGIDISGATQSITVATMFKDVVFTNVGTATDYSYQMLTNVPENYERLAAMVVPQLRGGADMLGYENHTITAGDLLPGDVLYLVNRSNSRYWTGVCIAENKILFSEYRGRGNVYRTYKIYDFTSDTDGTAFAQLMAADPVENTAWQCYLVLRPSQGFYDINDPVGTAALDAENTNELLAVKDDYSELTENNTGFAVAVYEKIGLDIGTIFPRNSNHAYASTSNIWNALFAENENGKYAPVESTEAYAPALVAALRGGTSMAEASDISTSISNTDLEPGDILFQGNSSKSAYYVSVYLGSGYMLTRQYDKTTAGNTGTLLHTFSGESAENFGAVIAYDADGDAFEYFFVLRPYLATENINILKAQLDRDIWGALASDSSAWSDSVDTGFAEEIYKTAGLDIHGITERTSMQSMIAKLFTQGEDGIYRLNGAVSASCGAAMTAMWGGEKTDGDNDFAYTDLEIGDILYQGDDTTGACYVSVYMGDGKLLTRQYNSKNCLSVGTVLYCFGPTGENAGTFQSVLKKDLQNNGELYDYYFVLRPSQAVEEITEHNLDWYYDDRLQALANDYSDLTGNNAAFATEVYKVIGLDISQILTTTSTAALRNNLFTDGSINSSVSAEYANAYAALVTDLVGGSDMNTQPGFGCSDLLPGDILLQYYYTDSLSYYDVSVYLGEGKLLMRQYENNGGTKTGTTVLYDFGENGANAGDFAEVLTKIPGAQASFQTYFVLRPGQTGLVVNCQLSETNQDALLDLPDNYSGLTSNNAAFANAVYSAIGMDVSDIITTSSTATILNNLFTTASGKYVVSADSTAAYAAALVPELRGGSLMAQAADIRAGFGYSALEPGDVLLQYYYTSTLSYYYVSVYLGDGLMLTRQYVNNNGTKTGTTVLYDFSAGGADEGTFFEMLNVVPGTETRFQAYFVLRPAQV